MRRAHASSPGSARDWLAPESQRGSCCVVQAPPDRAVPRGPDAAPPGGRSCRLGRARLRPRRVLPRQAQVSCQSGRAIAVPHPRARRGLRRATLRQSPPLRPPDAGRRVRDRRPEPVSTHPRRVRGRWQAARGRPGCRSARAANPSTRPAPRRPCAAVPQACGSYSHAFRHRREPRSLRVRRATTAAPRGRSRIRGCRRCGGVGRSCPTP